MSEINYRQQWAEGEIEAGTLLDAIDALEQKYHTLQEDKRDLLERLGELDNRHSDNCFYMERFKARIQKMLGDARPADGVTWFELLDQLEEKICTK